MKRHPEPSPSKKPAGGEETKTTCLKVKLFSRPRTIPHRRPKRSGNKGNGHRVQKYHPSQKYPRSQSWPALPPSNTGHCQPVILDRGDGDDPVPVPGPKGQSGTADRANTCDIHFANGPISTAITGGGGVVVTQTAVNNFLNAYRSRNLSPATIDWYHNILGRFARVCPKFPRRPEPIEAFLASVKGSPNTKHDYFRALKTFFKFTAERRESANPMAKVRVQPPKKMLPATLDDKELMMLLASATTLRDRAILTLLVDSGIRSGELSGLRVQNVKAEVVKVCGKTGEREVPISEQTHRLLEALISLQPNQEYVFLGHKGPLGKHGIYRIVRIHMKKAGIKAPKLGPHRCRHAFGKVFLVSGGDLRSLQLLMGHKRITTTEIYTRLATNELIDKHHKFTPLRAAHAAAQESLWKDKAMKEAEEILERKPK